jgi:thiamine-monophosphate kinase
VRAGRKSGGSRTPPKPRKPGAGSSKGPTVGETGEFELIDRLVRILGSASPESPAGPGDDAAVLGPRRTNTLVTTDVQEENVHFRRSWTLPGELGEKALEINLSDIAAMGGVPTVCLVSLVLPPELPLRAIEDLYRGLRRSAIRSGVKIAGGNISSTRSGRLSIHVTQLGNSPGRLVCRDGGSPGDLLVVTGIPGLAALGRRLIERSAGPESLWDDGSKLPAWRRVPQLQGSLARAALARFLTPRARVKEGPLVAGLGATAMIDVSDGLAGDLRHLAAAGGTGIEIDLERLPRPAGVDAVCAWAGAEWQELALTGGEDYELLFSIPESRWIEATRPRGSRFSVIGRLTTGRQGLTVRDRNGVRPLFEEGFHHF